MYHPKAGDGRLLISLLQYLISLGNFLDCGFKFKGVLLLKFELDFNAILFLISKLDIKFSSEMHLFILVFVCDARDYIHKNLLLLPPQ